MREYDFTTSKAIGEKYEKILDNNFRQIYRVNPVNRYMQSLGVDRVFIHKKNRYSFTVEYKSDLIAHKTGNAFIETVSVDDDRLGWAFSSVAQMLAYYVVEDNYAIAVPMLRIKYNLDYFERYPKKTVQNDGYQSEGLLVPLRELKLLGKVIEIKPEV